MTVIDLEGVTRIYHVGDIEVQALAGVDLRVESGEFLALMGASGSGKSTMLNILGCLDRPSSGRYRFEGVGVADRSEPELAHIRSERIGFVFQSFNLLARTTAVENVALPLFYAANGPANRSERRARAWKALASLGLAARELNTPSQLSGGQQQRVAIARALINVPGVILADEPTGNLDSRTSEEIMELLRELNRDHGVTIIVVTHDPSIAAYTDRVVTMRDGRVVSDEMARHEKKSAAANMADVTIDRPAGRGRAGFKLGASWAFALMVLAAAAQAIMRNKLRAVLTMLGVFIGVAALIAMVDVGQGANAGSRSRSKVSARTWWWCCRAQLLATAFAAAMAALPRSPSTMRRLFHAKLRRCSATVIWCGKWAKSNTKAKTGPPTSRASRRIICRSPTG